MKKAFFVFLLTTLTFCSFIYGQETKLDAREFDQFGTIDSENLSSRLDIFAQALRIEPNSVAYVVVYRGKDNLVSSSYRYGTRIKTYLEEHKLSNRIIINSGKLSDQRRVLLYIISNPPFPSDYLHPPDTNLKKSFLFDLTYHKLPTEEFECCGMDY